MRRRPRKPPVSGGPPPEQAAPAGPEVPGEPVTLPPSGLASEALALVGRSEPPAPPAASSASPSWVRAVWSPAFDRPVPAPAPPGLDLVAFQLGAGEYALDLRTVLEVVRVGGLTSVPRAPDFVAGLMNLRGRIIPVVDLKRKLGMGEVDRAARRARVIVAHWGPRVLGLLVDGATHVLHVLLPEVQAPPEGLVSPSDPIVAGIVRKGERLLVLVDVERLLGIPEMGGAPP